MKNVYYVLLCFVFLLQVGSYHVAQAALGLSSPASSFLSSWDYRNALPCLAPCCFLTEGKKSISHLFIARTKYVDIHNLKEKRFIFAHFQRFQSIVHWLQSRKSMKKSLLPMTARKCRRARKSQGRRGLGISFTLQMHAL